MEQPALDAPTTDWLVYADALQIAGDPRAHVANDRARDTYVHKHADALLGPAAKAYRKGAYRLAWRHCFITSADVRITAADHGEHWVRTLLALPAATHLASLTITGVTDDERPVDLTAAIGATTSTPWPPSLQMLALVDERATRAYTQIATDHQEKTNLVQFGPLDAIWLLAQLRQLRQHRQLRHLRLEFADATTVDFGTIEGAHLESLAIRALRTCTFDNEIPFLPALADTTWPHLTSLELRLAESFYANVPREHRPYRHTYYPDMQGEPDDGNAAGFDFHALVSLF